MKMKMKKTRRDGENPRAVAVMVILLKNSENVYGPSLRRHDENIVYRRNVPTRSRKNPIHIARVSRRAHYIFYQICIFHLFRLELLLLSSRILYIYIYMSYYIVGSDVDNIMRLCGGCLWLHRIWWRAEIAFNEFARVI